jgi:hypothetical protein
MADAIDEPTDLQKLLEDYSESDPPEADEYSIEVSVPDNEMRIQFFNEDLGALSSFTCKAADAYDFARRILQGYDRLEGIQ